MGTTIAEVGSTEYFVNMDRVMNLYLRGTTNLTQLAKATGLKRAEVMQYIEEWRKMAASNEDIKQRAKDNLAEMDEHYSMIISETWRVVEDADANCDLKTKATALKNLADIESKRQDTLQKAGLYDDAELGDQLALMAEQAEAIKKMLVSLSEKYPEAKKDILDGLRRIFAGEQVSVVAEDDINEKEQQEIKVLERRASSDGGWYGAGN